MTWEHHPPATRGRSAYVCSLHAGVREHAVTRAKRAASALRRSGDLAISSAGPSGVLIARWGGLRCSSSSCATASATPLLKVQPRSPIGAAAYDLQVDKPLAPEDAKRLVRRGYDRISHAYRDDVGSSNSDYPLWLQTHLFPDSLRRQGCWILAAATACRRRGCYPSGSTSRGSTSRTFKYLVHDNWCPLPPSSAPISRTLSSQLRRSMRLCLSLL